MTKRIVHWTTFLYFWKSNYAHIKIRNKGADTCTDCLVYFNAFRMIDNNRNNRQDNDNDSDDDDDDDDHDHDDNEENGLGNNLVAVIEDVATVRLG